MRKITADSVEYGWRVPAVKWLMLSSLFSGGVGFYAFYALQPYLLELYGNPDAYVIAGLSAAIVAGAQIVGGLAAPVVRRMFRRRTTALLTTGAVEVTALALIGLVDSFWAVLGLIVVWGLMYAAATPIRQSYLNGLIPSRQRATVLSFDSMMASLGGVGAQPALGRVADVWGYGSSYVASAGLTALSLPFVWLARRQHAVSDVVNRRGASAPGGAAGTGTS